MLFVHPGDLQSRVCFAIQSNLGERLQIGALFINHYVKEVFPMEPYILPVWIRTVGVISKYTRLSDQLRVLKRDWDAETNMYDRQDNSERKKLLRV